MLQKKKKSPKAEKHILWVTQYYEAALRKNWSLEIFFEHQIWFMWIILEDHE